MKQLALLCVVLCLSLSGMGCIYIPTVEFGDNIQKDFRPFLGPPDSKADIRPGTTSVARVIELLGKPYQTEENGSLLAYKYEPTKGVVLSPLGHFGGHYFHSRYLFLRFDGGEILSAYKVVAEPYFDNNAYDFEGELNAFNESTKPIPHPTG